MYLKTKLFKNRPSILVNEFDLQTIIHYTDVGDRAVIHIPSESPLARNYYIIDHHINGRITEVSPRGIKARVWNGDRGTIYFFKWDDIIEIKKSTVKQKPQTKNRYVIIGLISMLVIGLILLYEFIN